MKSVILSFALLSALPVAAQQLPAGTRSVANEDEDRAELYKKAQSAMEAQKFAEAEPLLQQIIKQDPKNAAALYQLAFAQEAQDKNDAAAASYKAAITADPDQFESYVALGLLEARINHPGPAHEYLTKAVTLKPADESQGNAAKARAYRALAQLDQPKNPAAARDELIAALKLSPETPDDILLSAELADAAGDTADAQAQYKKLLTTQQSSPEATISYVRFLMRHGQTGMATPLLEQLLAANPADANLKRLLGRIYAQTSQPAKAEPLLRAAVEATPDDPSLIDDLGSSLVLQQKFPEAQQLFTRALAIPADKWPSPQTLGEAAGHLAFAASQNHQPKIVLQALALRATLLPNSPSTLFLEATANDSLHQTKQAIDLYRQFLSAAAGKFPDQEWQAKHRLTALEHMK